MVSSIENRVCSCSILLFLLFLTRKYGFKIETFKARTTLINISCNYGEMCTKLYISCPTHFNLYRRVE